MSQDWEPSLLDYAHFHGLVHDHLERDPLSGFRGPDDQHLQLKGSVGASKDAEITIPPSERLSASKDVAMLLSSVIAPPEGTHLFSESSLLKPHRHRNLKMELPILQSIHELDVLEFNRRIIPKFASEHLPLEKIDDENDEGIGWPSSCYCLPQTYNALAMFEKFDAPKETLRYLESVMKPSRKAKDVPNVHDVMILHKRRAIIEPVTPPLLPLSPLALAFIPSSEIGHLALLSDHTTPTKQLAHELEFSILAPDAIAPDKVVENDYRQGSDPAPVGLDDLGQLCGTFKGVQEPPSSPPLRRPKLTDLKVEGPLTPPLSEQLPPWKTKGVCFREVLIDIISDKPPPIEKPEDVSSENTDTFMAETITPVATKVDRELEQEQLQQADTTRRVTVPIMDFSLPVPPWKAHSTDVDGNVQILRSLLKAGHLKSRPWPADGKAEREMRWAPFPNELGRIATEEDIPSDGVLADFLARPDCVDTSILIWKPDGLRILDDIYQSDEEELEHGTFPEATDMDSLVRKRKLYLQNVEDVIPGITVRDFGNDRARESTCGGQKVKYAHKKLQEITHSPVRSRTYPAMLGSTLSALGSLESFMRTRSGEVKKPKLVNSSYFATATPQHNALTRLSGTTSSNELPRESPTVAPEKLSLPAPDIAVPGDRQFVISSTFSSNKKLFRRLQELFPAAEFIERDFTLHSARNTSSLGSKISLDQDSDGTMADEADIVISPGTGLICTTLQKIRQRALPNQILWSSVRERVIRTSSRYEKLLVIVSEGRLEGDIMGAPDSQDCEAMTEFICLCTQLVCEAQVIYVGGGDEDLAKWIVGVMASHAPTSPDLKLLQDETLWEIFLRRAGMNAYGAQVILAELKSPTNDMKTVPGTLDQVVEFGLTAFVKMSLEERLRRFETMFGGRRLLLRVSDTLDARW